MSSTTIDETPAAADDAGERAPSRRGLLARLRDDRRTAPLLVAVLAVAFAASLVVRFALPHDAAGARMPVAPTVEAALGVRFSQVVLLGSAGLVEVQYTVLDPEKASTFQSDTKHPPVLYSERDRSTPVYRSELMRQGHNLRAGQTYFILYSNNHGVIRSGDTIEIDTKAGAITGVPVQ